MCAPTGGGSIQGRRVLSVGNPSALLCLLIQPLRSILMSLRPFSSTFLPKRVATPLGGVQLGQPVRLTVCRHAQYTAGCMDIGQFELEFEGMALQWECFQRFQSFQSRREHDCVPAAHLDRLTINAVVQILGARIPGFNASTCPGHANMPGS
jgi:hypothetical protein